MTLRTSLPAPLAGAILSTVLLACAGGGDDAGESATTTATTTATAGESDASTTDGATASTTTTTDPTATATTTNTTTTDPTATTDPTGETDTGETDTGDGIDYPPGILCPPFGEDPRCGPPYDPDDPLSPEDLDKAYAEGLEAWRYPGIRGACAGCHSPDAYDLALVGYADADILRRAVDHVSMEQAEALVAFIHAVRQKHDMQQLLHPAKYRPLQPTFESFEHTTPGLEPTDGAAQDERDVAFMDSLLALNLLWANGEVDTLAKAHQAYDELNALDLAKLKIGIPFDHLSEDGHWGDEHLSVFEWYPFMASTPHPADEAAWYAAVDAYLADPSDESLWGYYDLIDEMTACEDDLAAMGDPDYYGRACTWMRLKWKSLQVHQHMMRRGIVHFPDALVDQAGSIVDHVDLVIERIPIWEAGDFVRIAPLQRPPQTACFMGDNHPCTFLPPVVDQTVHSMPTYEEARIKQGEVFQQSWFVMSFLRDPGLLHQGPSFATFIGDYLESVLLARYDIHHALFFAKMAVAKSAATEWMNAPGFREGTGKIASVRTFSFKQIRDNFSPPPMGDPRYAAHRRMFANFARMWLYLIEEDLKSTGEIYDRDEVLYAVRFMRTWFLELEGAEDPAMNQLVLSIEGLAAAATELRSQANKDQNPGTGLQPTGTWGAFAEPYAG